MKFKASIFGLSVSVGVLAGALLFTAPAQAVLVSPGSTGTNGSLQVLGNTLLAPGRYDFTDVFVGANATLSFSQSTSAPDIFCWARVTLLSMATSSHRAPTSTSARRG